MAAARETELGASLAAVRDRLTRAAQSAKRNADEIQLLPVTKFFPASDVISLHRMGCSEFGESRAQEASAKAAEVNAELSGDTIRWHMVGRIQRNKVKAIADWAHTAHSVDDVRVVTALDRAVGRAIEEGRRSEPLRVYLQISLDGDTGRGGVDLGRTDLVDALAAATDDAQALRLVGLMGIPPLGADADEAFGALAAERDRLAPHCRERLGLSAGMSGDLEAAVRHGSTCVRVGTALLGQRPLPSP